MGQAYTPPLTKAQKQGEVPLLIPSAIPFGMGTDLGWTLLLNTLKRSSTYWITMLIGYHDIPGVSIVLCSTINDEINTNKMHTSLLSKVEFECVILSQVMYCECLKSTTMSISMVNYYGPLTIVTIHLGSQSSKLQVNMSSVNSTA